MSKGTATEIVVAKRQLPLPAHALNPAPLPEALEGMMNVTAWFQSLVNKAPYEEPNGDYMAQRMLMLTILSPTPEAVMTPMDLPGLQNIIPNTPGAGTGPIEITELYVAESDQKDGNPTYMLFTYVNLETGDQVTTTTGATQLQAQFATLVAMGVWPLRGQIKRTERQDRGDRYLFWFFPVD